MVKVKHEYTREDYLFLKTPIEILWQGWIKRRKLVVDFTLKPGELGGKAEFIREEHWTDLSKEEIHAAGYDDAEGLHDNIFWTWIPMYCKIHNGKEFPIAEVYPEKKDTAYTLNDAMQSNSEREFKKSMARAQLTASADWQKLGLMALLGVGVIIATKYFGIW